MDRLRIATWNLDHASNGRRPVALQIETIRRIAPDILVLTETCAEVDLAPHGYACIRSLPNEYGKYYSSIHLGPRVKLIAPIPTYDGITAVCARIETQVGVMTIYGTIITYHGDKGATGDAPAWAEHYKAITDHGNDWAALAEEANRIPLLAAGDFNQTRDGSRRSYGTRRGREMLGAELSRNELACLTTEDFGATGKLAIDPATGRARNNIDHICMTRDAFRVVQVGAWDHFTENGRYLSDHNGVFVDLERRAT